jgi:predicted SnoaL-like aldol condensation-catalyzing enzyme
MNVSKISRSLAARLATTTAILGLLAFPGLAQAAHGRAQSPKQVVDAIDQLILEHHPKEALHRYFAADFVEHDPLVDGGGLQGLAAYMSAHGWDPNGNVQQRDIIDRTIVEGPYVVVEHHLYRNAKDPGAAFVDTYRVVGGLVREHWDVMQPITSNPTNKNTMY